MRRLHQLTRRKRCSRNPAAENASRRGSTIVVVIALLLALTFLGIVGYTIGTQERGNAEYFADGSDKIAFNVSRDALFDWSLRQIILGTRYEERQSALHGGHMSLMATMFGHDMIAYNGYGTNLAFDATNNIFVDQNYNGVNDGPATDGPAELIEINRAPFAEGPGAAILDQLGNGYQAPDVGYSYWDVNNPALAYINTDHVVNAAGQTRGVVLPSYHRPQYLRSTGISADQWYQDPATRRRVLRPHKEHRAVAANGQVTDTPRFISNLYPDPNVGSFPFTANTGPPRNDDELFPQGGNRASSDSDPTNDGVWDGVWNGGAGNEQNMSYDADADNDGFNEAIWMDLGYPMQVRENPDGTVTKFVPMFAVTLYDADSLLNLNAGGNLAGVDPSGNFNNALGQFGPLGPGPNGTYDGGGDDDLRFVSQSNQGVSISENNPQWGMTANPGDGPIDQHQRFFGHAPSDRIELSNMEWWFLMSGRADLDASSNIDQLHPGRRGEIDTLDNAMSSGGLTHAYPKPGESFLAYPGPGNFNPSNPSHRTADDNLDAEIGGNYPASTIPTSLTYFPPTLQFPAWREPLDLHGSGRFTAPNPNSDPFYGRERLLESQGQHQWPAYRDYQATHEVGLYANASTRFLLPNYTQRYNVDEPVETILEPRFMRSDLDSPFGAGENATLHLAQADQDNLGLSGRLRELAPVNFDGDDPVATEARRRRFTTTSWDLKSYNTARFIGGTAPQVARNHETTLSFNNHVAIRRPLRELLRENETPFNNDSYHRRKLSPNHLCVFEGGNPAGNVIFRPLTPHPDGSGAFGPLGPQPVNNTTVMTVNSTPAAIGSAADQEWFARRDRQQLCRDIYTLLYLYGGENDNINYATTPRPYTRDVEINKDTTGDGVPDDTDGIPDELLEMAQFAVNLVDRMDPDHTATKFEFDINLANGWNLDDDPYTDSTTASTPGYMGSETGDVDGNAGNERAVVYGVEEQLLTINEAQIVLARRVKDDTDTPTNHHATEYDDQKNRDWTYIELMNVSRENVVFNENWQLVLEPDPTRTNQSMVSFVFNPANPTEPKRLTLLNGSAPSAVNLGNGIYTIGTAGDEENYGAAMGAQLDSTTGSLDSHFRVNKDYDPDGDNTGTPDEDDQPFDNAGFDFPKYRISPRGGLDLDLIDPAQAGNFRVHEGDLPGGTDDGTDFFTHTGDEHGDPAALDSLTDGDRIYFRLRLRRRLHLNRQPPTTAAESEDNPWIDVDVFETNGSATANPVDLDIFALEDDDKYMQIRQKLRQLRSSQRTEPLFDQTLHDYVGVDYKANRLGLLNQDTGGNIPTSYTRFHYQPHFNRDYGSAMELMSVPLYGPDELTDELQSSHLPNSREVAAGKFLNPEQDLDVSMMPIPGTGNRWYRLFEFLEVPDRSHRHPEVDASGNPIRPSYVLNLGNRQTNPEIFFRRPGRIQLNTLKHPEVLGGLLDDPEVAQLNLGNPNRHLPDQSTGTGSGTARDWWVQFVQARDGHDPVALNSGTQLFLPGLPDGGSDGSGNQIGSRPFRPLNFSHKRAGSLENTILRELPLDSAATPPRRSLFELGNRGQTVDHSVKYRMLEKVANNSTTRSNVFLIFVQVDFFEAVEVTDGGTMQNVVRVGAKLPDSPGYRGFFVVDRSKARDLLGPADVPQNRSYNDPIDTNTKQTFSFNPDFDFHQLILHRQTIN